MIIVYTINIGFMIGCLLTASFFYGRNYERKRRPEPKPKARAEPKEDLVKKLKRLNQEYANFLNYDGTPQEDIQV